MLVESGIAEALEKYKGGRSVSVESNNAENWAHTVHELSRKNPEIRHDSAICLRENYMKAYPWSTQRERFKEVVMVLLEETCCAGCDNGASPGLSGERVQRTFGENTCRPVSEGAETSTPLYDSFPLQTNAMVFWKSI